MKRIFRKILITILLLAAITGGIFLLSKFQPEVLSNLVSTVTSIAREYPKDFAEPKNITLKCNYRGKNLQISETLYGNINSYYETEPKKKLDFYQNNDKAFVFSYPEDNSIKDLTGEIVKVGKENKLNDDQTLDLASCFLQSIPYDEAKARKILSDKSFPTGEIIPRYPYETLYDFTGICTDKSFLGVAIFRELGYETALLDFDKERHMSIGISVPTGYGELGTKYAVMELTGEGFLVGDIPVLSTDIGLAQNQLKSVPEASDKTLTADSETKGLNNASNIEMVSEGKDYIRIVERTTLRKSIESLGSQLETQRSELVTLQNQVKTAEAKVALAEKSYRQARTSRAYQSYLTVYNSYYALLQQLNSKVASYNALVRTYNQKISQYKNY